MIYKQKKQGGKVFYAEVFFMTENTFKILEHLKDFIVKEDPQGQDIIERLEVFIQAKNFVEEIIRKVEVIMKNVKDSNNNLADQNQDGKQTTVASVLATVVASVVATELSTRPQNQNDGEQRKRQQKMNNKKEKIAKKGKNSKAN